MQALQPDDVVSVGILGARAVDPKLIAGLAVADLYVGLSCADVIVKRSVFDVAVPHQPVLGVHVEYGSGGVLETKMPFDRLSVFKVVGKGDVGRILGGRNGVVDRVASARGGGIDPRSTANVLTGQPLELLELDTHEGRCGVAASEAL